MSIKWRIMLQGLLKNRKRRRNNCGEAWVLSHYLIRALPPTFLGLLIDIDPFHPQAFSLSNAEISTILSRK